jgi:hypothetical protein
MNRETFWSAIVALALLFTAFATQARSETLPAPEKTEVFIGHIFVPTQGFDDNDSIQITLDGLLPNGCYSVASHKVRFERTYHNIWVRLFAYVKKDGPCADKSHLPYSVLAPAPYTFSISLGRLPEGTYRVLYPRATLEPGAHLFTVAGAKTSSIDDTPYAAVTSVDVPERVWGHKNVFVTIHGILTSTCSSLNGDQIKVIKTDDVFTILPKLSFDPSQTCEATSIPFQKTVSIGETGEGRFLVQVRSMNGRSEVRAFSAVMPDPE